MSGMRTVTASLLLALTAAAVAAPPAQLDFRKAVEKTFSSSPALKASRGNLRAARGAAAAAQGARWPHLSASLSASRSNDPLAVFGYKLGQRNVTFSDFGAGQFTGPNSLDIAPNALNYPGAYDNFNTSLQVKWPIYEGGRMSAAIAAARAAVKAAQNGDNAARQAVILEVLRAYEGVRAATAQLAVTLRAESAAVSDLASAQKRYKQGTAIRSDVLTAQVNLDQSRLARETAQDHLDTAREYLRILVGLPQGIAIAIGPPASPEMPREPLTTLQSEALAANPTLQSLQNRAKASQATVVGKEAAYRPHFSLVIRRDWNDRTLGIASPSYTVAGVVSWDLFDFGARRGAVQEAAGKLDAAEAHVNEFKQRLQVEVASTWRTAREAARRVKTDETAVEQAREAQRIIKLRFDQGLTTITELLAGQARLDKAEGNLVDARYSLRVSRATLLATIGQLDLAHIRSGVAAAPAQVTAPAAATGDSS